MKEVEKLEKNIVHYVQHHTFLMTVAVVSVFVILAVGELFLYRNQMKLNKMISEGFMQIKEQINEPTPTVVVPTTINQIIK